MRVRRPISVSASTLALVTISSASCRARSSNALRSSSTEAAFASYSAFRASASLRSDSASASWSRISAILLSSARPIAWCTFFQANSASTTIIASATQPPGFSQKAVGSCSASTGCATEAISAWLDIELRLHRSRGIVRVDRQTCHPADQLQRRFCSDCLDLRLRGREGLANAALRRFNLAVDLLGGSLDLRFGLLSALRLGVLGNPGGFYPRGVHPLPPRYFGLVGSRPRRLRRLEIPGDALLARIDSRLDLRHHPARDHEKDERKRDCQPQKLRQVDLGQLRQLRH